MKKPKTSSDDDFSFDFGGGDEFFPLDNPSSSSDKKNKPKGAKGYFKNVVKSVGRLGVKVAKDLYPDIFEFKDQFLAKDDNEPHFDIKGTIKNVRNEVHKYGNIAFDTAKEIKKNAKNSILTGEFAKDNEDSMMEEFFSGDDFDFSSFGSDDFGGDDGDYDSNESEIPDSKGKKRSRISSQEITAKSAMASARINTRLAGKQVAATYGAAQAQLQHQNILFSQQMDIFQEQHRQKMAVMKNIANNLIKVVNQNNISNRAQMEFSAKSLAFSQDMSALLKEIRNSQWSLTKAATKEDQQEQSEYDKMINGGGFNLQTLAKRFKNSIGQNEIFSGLADAKSMIDSMFDMGSGMGGSPAKMLSTMLGDGIRRGIVNKMLSDDAKVKINDFNMKAKGLPGALNRKFGTLAETQQIDEFYKKYLQSTIKNVKLFGLGDKIDDFVAGGNGHNGLINEIKEKLGSVVKVTDHVKESSGRYAMGNPDQVHPFDNKAHYVLTEVIPKQLSRIDAGVNHTEETYFDFKDNKFKTVSSMKDAKNKAISNTLNSLEGAYDYKQALVQAGSTIEDDDIKRILNNNDQIELQMHNFFKQNRDMGVIRDVFDKVKNTDVITNRLNNLDALNKKEDKLTEEEQERKKKLERYAEKYTESLFNELQRMFGGVDGFDIEKLKKDPKKLSAYVNWMQNTFKSFDNDPNETDEWNRNKSVKIALGMDEYASAMSKTNMDFEDRYGKYGSSITYDKFAKNKQVEKDIATKKARQQQLKDYLEKNKNNATSSEYKKKLDKYNKIEKELKYLENSLKGDADIINARSSYIDYQTADVGRDGKPIKKTMDDYAIKEMDDSSTHGIVQNIYNLLLEGIDVFPQTSTDENRKHLEMRKEKKRTAFKSKVQAERSNNNSDLYTSFDIKNVFNETKRDSVECFAYMNGISLYTREFQNDETFFTPVKIVKRKDKDPNKENADIPDTTGLDEKGSYYVLRSQYDSFHNKYYKMKQQDSLKNRGEKSIIKKTSNILQEKFGNIPGIGFISKVLGAFDMVNSTVAGGMAQLLGENVYGEKYETKEGELSDKEKLQEGVKNTVSTIKTKATDLKNKTVQQLKDIANKPFGKNKTSINDLIKKTSNKTEIFGFKLPTKLDENGNPIEGESKSIGELVKEFGNSVGDKTNKAVLIGNKLKNEFGLLLESEDIDAHLNNFHTDETGNVSVDEKGKLAFDKTKSIGIKIAKSKPASSLIKFTSAAANKISGIKIGKKTIGKYLEEIGDAELIEKLKECENPKQAAELLKDYAIKHGEALSEDAKNAFMRIKDEIKEDGIKSVVTKKGGSLISKIFNKSGELKKAIKNQVINMIPMDDGRMVGDHIADIGDKTLIENLNQAKNIKESVAVLREYGTEEAQNIANTIETYSKEHPLRLGIDAGLTGVVGLAGALLGGNQENTEENSADLKDTTTIETGNNVANTKEELEAKQKENEEKEYKKEMLDTLGKISDSSEKTADSTEKTAKDMKDGIKIDDKSLDGINSAISGASSNGLGGLFNSLDQMTGGALSKTGVGQAIGGFLNSEVGGAITNMVGSKLGIPGAKGGGGGIVTGIAGKKAMDLIGKFIGKGAAKGAGSAAGAAAKVAAEGAEALGKNSGLIGKILTNVTKSLDDFLKSPKIAKVLGSSGIKNIKNGLLGGIKKFSTKPSFLTRLAKNFTKALPFISIGLAVTDFFKGMGLVTKYFDLGKGIKPPSELRICSGLAEALSGLLFGIPGIIASFMGKSSFAELLFDWFGSKEMKSSMNRYHQYNEKRARIFGIDDPQALVAFEDRNKKGFSGAIQSIGRGARAVGHVLGKLGSGGSLVDSNEEKDCKTLKFKAVEIFKKWKTEKYDMLDQLYEKMANDPKYGGKNIVEDMNATNIINADSLMEYNEDGSLVEDDEYNQQICDRIDKQNLFRKEYLTACIQSIKAAGLAWLTNKCSIELFAKMTNKNAEDIKGLDNRTLGQKLMTETKFVANGFQTEEQVKAKQEKYKEWDKQQKEERKKIGQERDLKKKQLKDEKAAKKAAKQMNAKGRKGREATYNFYDYTDQTKDIMENASAMTQSVYSQYIAADKDISTSGVTGTAPMGEPTDRGGEPTKENYIFNMGKEKLKKTIAPLGSPMDYATKRMKESMANFSEQFTKNFTTDFSDKLVEKLQVLDAINAEQKRHNEETEKFFAACLGMMGQIAKQSGNVKIASKIDQMVSMVIE